jgi:hypothetical protein
MFICLHQDFIDYLLSDGIVLPEGCELPGYTTNESSSSCDSSQNDKDEWDDINSSDIQAPSFPELVTQLSDAIKSLDGSVFPKLNGHSPKVSY